MEEGFIIRDEGRAGRRRGRLRYAKAGAGDGVGEGEAPTAIDEEDAR